MTDNVLLNKTATIERCLARVDEEYSGHEAELETDYRRQDSIVLNLQRACEAAIDLAMHMTRTRRLGLPQDARDGFTLLEHAHIIDPDIATHMRAMVGFRNISVHAYQELSIPVLRAILDQRLGDFRTFTRSLLDT